MGLEDPNYEPRLRRPEPTPLPEEDVSLITRAESLAKQIGRGDISVYQGTMLIVNMVMKADQDARDDVMAFLGRRL